MSRYDFRSPRLFIDTPLKNGVEVTLDRNQTNYLVNVMRLNDGDPVLLFNGRDGEWRGGLSRTKRDASVAVAEQTRQQPASGDVQMLFAPLKHARLDYMVQKFVEMGASRLTPILTQHTQVSRVNGERMRANAIEAAEQCGVLALPQIDEPLNIKTAIGKLSAERLLVFCDEDAEVKDPVSALAEMRPKPSALLPLAAAPATMPVAIALGPEGGFSDDERTMLLERKNSVRLSLGPRILRADTAAVAALALVQTMLGDWREAAS